MHKPFYEKVKKLQEKLKDCSSRAEVKQMVQTLDIDLLVSYDTNSFFSFTESFKDEQGSGTLSFSVSTEVTNGKEKVIGRPTSFYVQSPGISTKNVERKYVEAIIHTLMHLDLEETEDE